MIFKFLHMAYEVPADIDITVYATPRTRTNTEDLVMDFDFIKDGQVIAMYGRPSWEDAGIKVL